MSLCASADTQVTVIEENDALSSSQDRHYTQGILFSVLTPELRPGCTFDQTVDRFGSLASMFRRDDDGGSHRRIEWTPLGQSIFTPQDLHRSQPDPLDRPYAGWLYSGVGLLQENGGNRIHDVELRVGVVGASAEARQVQDLFHRWIGVGKPQGYGSELHDRPGIQFSYLALRRIGLIASPIAAVDWVPEAGIDLGNVFRTLEIGSMLRLGNALQMDYGPERIRPALSGTAFRVNPTVPGRLHYEVFIGTQLRYVEANTFIDRASEVTAQGLARKSWVTDWMAGAEVFPGRHLRLGFEATRRSREFLGQQGADLFGSIVMGAGF